MNITALTGTGQQTQAIGRPSPLLSVMAWEFRRFLASRLFWFQALGLFGFLLLMTWALHAPDQFSAGVSRGGGGSGESLSGLLPEPARVGFFIPCQSFWWCWFSFCPFSRLMA